MKKLFIDLDGVLADFDTQYLNVFGYVPVRDTPQDVKWGPLTKYNDGHFYRDLPMMIDAMILWDFVKHHNPTILTAIPFSLIHAADDKRSWVSKYFGADIPVITCFAKEKSNYAMPGDIIVDDQVKYKQLWEDKRGIWITHTSAATSIIKLKKLGYEEGKCLSI